MTDKEREREARSIVRDVCKVLGIVPTDGQIESLIALFMSRTLPVKPTRERQPMAQSNPR